MMPGVEIPARAQLVPALLERLRTPTADRTPLAVLDPTWPAALVRQARRDLVEAASAGRLTSDDLVVFTSGSSGVPRAVVRTLESWRASLRPLSEVTGLVPGQGHRLVWVPGPLTSSLFLYGALHAAWCGYAWTGGRARDTDVRPATAAHVVPAQLADALDAADEGLLPHLRTVVVAGAGLPGTLRRRAERAGMRVVEYYGAAELSFVGWRDTDGPFQAFPGAQVRIGDNGALWVRSPYVARHYLRPDERAPWRQTGGWHTVGDLAAPAPGGWSLLGRGDAAVTTGGHTVLVGEVESVLRQVTGVRAVAVLGTPHPRLGQVVTAVVSPERPDRADQGMLLRRLQQKARELPGPARPRRWLLADVLPLLVSGKIDRTALAARAEELDALR
jgi:acyl-coenzyme A synthetase/AMP-(fatty) acid ligase